MGLQFACLGIVVAGVCVLITLERLFPYDKGQRIFREEFWNDLIVYTFLQSYVCGAVISLLIAYIDTATGLSRMQIVADWPIIGQLAFFIITHEIFQYWFHRTEHRRKYLWRIHETQHATPEVDWLVGSRAHILEIMIAQTVEYAPIILLGAPPEVALYKGVINSLWGMYNHSNINVRSGRLIYFLMAPNCTAGIMQRGCPVGALILPQSFPYGTGCGVHCIYQKTGARWNMACRET